MPTPTPTRSLILTGASNFRDLGGYAGQGGRAVQWRRLFRSDHLAALTPQDVAQLASLGLTRAYDFRGEAERAAVSYALPGVTSYSLPIEPTVVQRMKDLLESGHQLTAQDTVRLMQQTYRAFVHDNSPRFAELFGHLLDSNAPLVFHCTAGKDRTGFAAALILLALGVPRPVVMQDYLLTNELFLMPPTATPGLASQEVLNVLWRVQEDFLDAALHAVEADFGGVPKYLEQTMGLGPKEQARLATLYLQP
ncbi:tyrosine-protein phosphatase [Rhodoferax sp. UBA5149]|uniref:tyrosine-protein phosphatase n=1 Tax=Rhodoferax sp. UBA5149 TaxID=1947379 RepID=UPI0025E3548C|nr:tyrosine-protein phosphatase [Rhodoferax sp. UBA5149]